MSEVKIVADTCSLQELKPIEFPRLQVRFTKKKRMEEKKRKVCDKVYGFEDYFKITDKRRPFFETKRICIEATEGEWRRTITKGKLFLSQRLRRLSWDLG